MSKTSRIKPIHLLLLISFLIRAFLAGWMELGNDEVYYWTYAMFPDWSHFDHPGMVGWIIQLFSLNLLFDSEFFIRLSSVVFMTLNTWIMYQIGKELRDEATGFRAALLYTASVYAFVITGIFIMPDTPLCLFWLLAFWMILKPHNNQHLLLFGLFAGLAMLSKYSGIFLWIGFGLYLLCYERKTLQNPILYVSLIITALCCFPILYWNIQNDFISFRFHSGRVGIFESFSPISLITELVGEFGYNNPVNYVIALLAVIASFRKRLSLPASSQQLILLTALPMIGLFLLFSMTRPTLPHWSGPAFILLILLSANWMENLHIKTQKKLIVSSISILILILVIGVVEIKTGFIPLDHHTEEREVGKDDFTLDLYGWRQLGQKFADVRAREIAAGEMSENDAIIGNNWFPTANIDYYVGRPLGLKTLGYGPLDHIHKYQWINEKRGGFEKKANYWYLADSHFFIDPEKAYAYTNFKKIRLVDVIPIKRNGKTVRNIFVYECKSLVYGPPTLEEVRGKR